MNAASMAPGCNEDRLPPLRQDLALHAGPTAEDGSPTWTLHDPAANRFFQISWPAFELLSRWPQGRASAVLNAVQQETTLTIGTAELNGLVQMLAGNSLLQRTSAQDTQRLSQMAATSRMSAGKWLLKNYLFMRVPLVRPMAWLQRLGPYMGWAFQPMFWMAIALCALTGLALTSQRWDAFTHTFASYTSWQGLLAIGIAVSFAKVLHELGHAFTAARYGCRVGTMGVAFLVMWPVLYTDTNEAWKLRHHHQRARIAAAGMLSELALAAVATLAWALLPDSPAWGPVKAAAFLLGTTTWVITLAINASPFMRFDGYFLLSDAMGLPNLHERAFALGRWWLRERLFGLGEPEPEQFSTGRRRFLIAFAFGTWLYRLLLFLGIALLVYHVFFKALGVVLMAVELVWFIGRPVWMELKAWGQRRQRLRWNRQTRRSVALLGLTLLALVWPWQSRIRAPAVLTAQHSQTVYAPVAARVEQIVPPSDRLIKTGEVLLTLSSPELAAQLAQAELREARLRWQVEQQPFNAQLAEAGPALRSRWQLAQEELRGLRGEAERLTVRMPFDGRVVDLASDLHAGVWVTPSEPLLQAISPGAAKVDAFLDEDQARSLPEQPRGAFVSHIAEGRRVSCSAAQLDAVQVSHIEHASIASVYGGELPTQRGAQGRIEPLHPSFRLRLSGCDLAQAPGSETAGTALIHGERRSMLTRAWRWLHAVWVRETSL